RDIHWIIAGFAVLLTIPLIGLIRWIVILRMQGIQIGVYEALRIHLIGVFFNAILFGSLGGDVLKAYYVAKGAGSSKKAASVITIFLDRILGALGFVVLTGLGILIAWEGLVRYPRFKLILVVVGIIAAGWMSVLIVLLIPWLRALRKRMLERFTDRQTAGGRIARALNDADEAVQEARRHPWASLFCIGISVGTHFANAVAFCFFAMALGVTGPRALPFAHYVALAPIALLGPVVPTPAGGLGVGGGVASIVFGPGVGVAKWVGGTIVILWRIGNFILGPVGFVYFVFHREEVRRAREAAQEIGPDDALTDAARKEVPEGE
ncbi:MAG: lysylphosphatidylglycerol synthase transmembrane domain-containing protein, partial [Planctomycetota bacterium]